MRLFMYSRVRIPLQRFSQVEVWALTEPSHHIDAFSAADLVLCIEVIYLLYDPALPK